MKALAFLNFEVGAPFLPQRPRLYMYYTPPLNTAPFIYFFKASVIGPNAIYIVGTYIDYQGRPVRALCDA